MMSQVHPKLSIVTWSRSSKLTDLLIYRLIDLSAWKVCKYKNTLGEVKANTELIMDSVINLFDSQGKGNGMLRGRGC